MNILTALLQFLLALFGLGVGSDHSHRISVDGVDTLYSKAHVEAGVARFECLTSESGQCHYTLYPQNCPTAPFSARTRVGDCGKRPIRRFALASGDSREIVGMSSFRLCVSAGSETLAADCGRPKPMTAR